MDRWDYSALGFYIMVLVFLVLCTIFLSGCQTSGENLWLYPNL